MFNVGGKLFLMDALLQNQTAETQAFVKRVLIYFVVMLFGIVANTYVTHSITVVWIVNLLGLAVLFFPYLRYTESYVLKVSLIYIGFCMVTLALNTDYLTASTKAIGTNINILIVPIFLNILYYVKRRNLITTETITKILKWVSVLGTIALIFTLLTSYGAIMSVFGGESAYHVDVSGFFYSKNIYGAFISLTIGADLYLLNKTNRAKRLFIILLKILAVVVSFSRAALLQMTIMLFLFIWLKKNRRLRDYFLTLVLLCVLAVTAYFILTNQNITDFITDGVLRLDSGDAGRQFLREQAMQKMNGISNILFGVGFAGIEQLDIDVDNTYLYLLFSGGIIKIAFYIYFIVIAFKNIVPLKKTDEQLYRICMAVAISYLVFAFFESVAVLELGLLNFLFTMFMFLFPFARKEDAK